MPVKASEYPYNQVLIVEDAHDVTHVARVGHDYFGTRGFMLYCTPNMNLVAEMPRAWGLDAVNCFACAVGAVYR